MGKDQQLLTRQWPSLAPIPSHLPEGGMSKDLVFHSSKPNQTENQPSLPNLVPDGGIKSCSHKRPHLLNESTA